jgi:hypothetical protein
MNISETDRFLSHVDKKGPKDCWLWTAVRLPYGYGQFRLPLGHELAHRTSFRLFVGPLENDKEVMHSCDNPPCVNPKHLSLGTRAENAQDAKRKGRTATGERHGRHRLTKGEIAFARSSTLFQREIAEILGTTQGHVSRIRLGKRWGQLIES